MDKSRRALPRATRWLFVAALLGLLACATTRQILPVTPQLDTAALPAVGEGRALVLKVVDARGDNTVGYRRAGDESTAITTAPEALRNIRRALEQALPTMGFRLVQDGAAADLTLEVRVQRIGFERDLAGPLRDVDIAVEIGATSDSATRTARGTYRDGREWKTLLTPSKSRNADVINELIESTLTKALTDPRLLGDAP